MNKKGFTLIELLAVIIVLGLVLVVTIPNVVTNINNNKLSSLNTLSKEVAKWVDNKLVEDKLSPTKTLSNINSDTWYCLNNVNGTNIASLYGLSSNDIQLDGELPIDISRELDLRGIDRSCSVIRIFNGSAEVLLIGKPDGKYGKGNIYSYALSTDTNGNFFE